MTAALGLVVVTPEELRSLISEAVADALTSSVAVNAPHVVDRAGLAAALGCSLATVDRLRAGGLPTIFVADAPRFDVAEILAYLKGKR